MKSGAMTVETLHSFFQGGEEDGGVIRREDVRQTLLDALQTILYANVRPRTPPRNPDRKYNANASFWGDAIAGKQFPSENVVLDDFVLMEWLPFAPGRYYTSDAEYERLDAARCVSPERDEYLPEGKHSMVRGGIGAIRLAEKNIGGHAHYFLGASSTGIAHQGIPVALPPDEYRKVMPIIKERGGCRATIIGSLQSLSDGMPTLRYDRGVPRYCLFAEEVIPAATACGDLLTTVAVMFTAESGHHRSWNRQQGDDPKVVNKSWTFCSFHPGSSGRDEIMAAEWLMDYAQRYSHGEPSILTDFDEHVSLFPGRVEFPLSDIIRGTVDWDTLRVYRNHFNDTFIQNYFEEYTHVAGDQIRVEGSNNIIVNRSKVTNAFNKIKREHDEEMAKALLEVAEAVDQSGNPKAVENFDAFNEELAKPKPKKSLLETLWNGTLAVLPAIKELPGVIDSITKLFV